MPQYGLIVNHYLPLLEMSVQNRVLHTGTSLTAGLPDSSSCLFSPLPEAQNALSSGRPNYPKMPYRPDARWSSWYFLEIAIMARKKSSM